MPYNGTGSFVPLPPPTFPAVGGTPISSAYFNAVILDILSGLSNAITRDGQGKPTTTIDWNGQTLANAVIPFTQAGAGAILRSLLLKAFDIVSAQDFGALPDFGFTNNTAAVQVALDSFPVTGGTLFIEKGIQWDYRAIAHPFEVTIIDYSGWDWDTSDWTGQEKHILKTASPGSKNANEFKVIAPYNPAVVIDNVNTGTPDWHSSLVFRLAGASDWQLTPDAPTAPGTDRRFQISFYGTYGGVAVPGGTNVFGIDPYEGNFGFNALPQPGADYYFDSTRNNTFIFKKRAMLANGFEDQWSNVTHGLLLQKQISGVDGSFNYFIAGVAFDFHTANQEVYGNRIFVAPKTTNYTITAQETGKTFTNQGAPGGFTFNLPPAVTGLSYRFSVRAAQNMRIDPSGAEYFIGFQSGGGVSTKAAGKYMESTQVGAVLEIVCSEAGVWDYIRYGTWTDE